ncbi:MAG: hypothetical protein K2O18_11855 [Oscillospiraceae bacterium]|nr:hypothetical protein [Oscillospiraceae bacterium]
MKKLFCMVFLAVLLLTGCEDPRNVNPPEWVEQLLPDSLINPDEKTVEAVNGVLSKAGEGTMKVIDGLKNAEYKGGPFENNLESARAYLLEQLREKYGTEFVVVDRERLTNYGLFAGATYTCQAAPAGAPDQIISALVSQSMYRNVRDDYAVYFFKEEAEAQAIRLCTETEYVQEFEISLRMPETEKVWSASDGVNDFLQTSGAYLDIEIRLEEGRSDGEYADLILDFLEKAYALNADVQLSVLESKNSYLFWGTLHVLGETSPQLPAKEKILEDMEINRMMGLKY